MFPTLTTILRSLAVILIATMSPAQDRATAQTENQPIASRRLTESRISFVAHHNSGEAVWAVTEKGQIHIVDPLTLEPLTHFIMPGGSQSVSAAHLARTVCRRAERRCVALANESEVESIVILYLNRLSDFFFVLARWLAHREGIAEIKWQPRKKD